MFHSLFPLHYYPRYLLHIACSALFNDRELPYVVLIFVALYWGSCWLKCCFTSRETVGLLGKGAQDAHLGFRTAPELCTGAADSAADKLRLFDAQTKRKRTLLILYTYLRFSIKKIFLPNTLWYCPAIIPERNTGKSSGRAGNAGYN